MTIFFLASSAVYLSGIWSS